MSEFTIGQRIKTKIKTSAKFADESGFPIGSPGVVDYVSPSGYGYGVVLDEDAYKLSLWYGADELEACDE